MPVGIIKVFNNTSGTLHYNNTQTGYAFQIKPKTVQWENDDWIPSSKTHDDTVPYYELNSENCIKVWINNGPRAEITDSDYKFSIATPYDHSADLVQKKVGSLENGGRYMLRVDERVDVNGVKSCAFSFLKYEEKFNTDVGYIGSQLLQHAAPIIANLLLDVLI